jgi:hypothetical protein
VMPRLEPVRGPSGEITDVRISYPCDLTKQMLEYSGMGGPASAAGGRYGEVAP